MLYLAFVIFVIVFLGGLFLAYQHFQENAVPISLALGHGVGGALGLVILYFVASNLGSTVLWVAFGLYVLAAVGGLTLTTYSRFIGDGAPKAMIVGHGLVAVLGCGALTLGVYGVLAG